MPSSTTSGGSGLHLGLVGAGRIGVMHARNIAATPAVGRLTIADADADHARRVAGEVGAGTAASVEELLGSGIDGLVVAASTASHPALIRAGVEAGLPVLCEKPVASDVPSSLPVLEYLAATGGVVQIGHQRRFDRGYLQARRAYRSGELGWIHSMRAVTCDAAPPPVAFLATSGGLFRDVQRARLRHPRAGSPVARSSRCTPAAATTATPRSARSATSTPRSRSARWTTATIATVTASRYNGAGHDVRLEIQGSKASLMVGLEDATPMRSAEPGVAFPRGPAARDVRGALRPGLPGRDLAFAELIRGERENPCTPADAVAASVVADAAQESLDKGAPVRVPATADAASPASSSLEQEAGAR